MVKWYLLSFNHCLLLLFKIPPPAKQIHHMYLHIYREGLGISLVFAKVQYGFLTVSSNICHGQFSPKVVLRHPVLTCIIGWNHCRPHNTNYIIMSSNVSLGQWFWHSHLRPWITFNQILTSRQIGTGDSTHNSCDAQRNGCRDRKCLGPTACQDFCWGIS